MLLARAAVGCSDGGMTEQMRRAGQWTVEDQIASPWQYVDVEVPPGTRALRVEVSYDRQAGVLDLGCFRPDGGGPGGAGHGPGRDGAGRAFGLPGVVGRGAGPVRDRGRRGDAGLSGRGDRAGAVAGG